jgi:hypothetical protein
MGRQESVVGEMVNKSKTRVGIISSKPGLVVLNGEEYQFHWRNQQLD